MWGVGKGSGGASRDTVVETDLAGAREEAAATAEGDGGEARQRDVKEDSRGGAKVISQRSDL